MISLSSMITASTVRAKVFVESWEAATDYVGSLLVDAGKIEPEYISAMKRVLREMGPYAVIAPGIVLLHARPEDGVLEPCLGLITLSTPVPFGHSQNDPVDIVFGLGAVDKKAHIDALQQLSRMLGDSDKLNSIRAARQGRELIKIFAGRA
jgi:mannitol/fructose-specific phosphotransferase system IIA component (Ntr-type)